MVAAITAAALELHLLHNNTSATVNGFRLKSPTDDEKVNGRRGTGGSGVTGASAEGLVNGDAAWRGGGGGRLSHVRQQRDVRRKSGDSGDRNTSNRKKFYALDLEEIRVL